MRQLQNEEHFTPIFYFASLRVCRIRVIIHAPHLPFRLVNIFRITLYYLPSIFVYSKIYRYARRNVKYKKSARQARAPIAIILEYAASSRRPPARILPTTNACHPPSRHRARHLPRDHAEYFSYRPYSSCAAGIVAHLDRSFPGSHGHPLRGRDSRPSTYPGRGETRTLSPTRGT